MSYRIKTISELTGIPINTISAWERRYQVLSPERDAGNGYRLYSDDDVETLRRLRAMVEQGYKISEAVSLVRQAPATRPVDGMDALRGQLKRALLAFDRPAADAQRHRLVLLPFQQAIDLVYLPMLREIGDEWVRGEVSIAQEHFASTWCRDQIVGMLLSLGSDANSGPSAVCAGFPGEMHEIGLLAVAVKLALRGFRISYFGPDLPLSELARHLVSHPPDFVCVSVMRTFPAREIRAFAEQLRASTNAAGRSPQLVVGGPAVEGVAPVEGVWFAPRFEDLVARLSS